MSKSNEAEIGKLQVAHIPNTAVSIPRSMLPKSRAFRRGGLSGLLVISKPAKRKTKKAK